MTRTCTRAAAGHSDTVPRRMQGGRCAAGCRGMTGRGNRCRNDRYLEPPSASPLSNSTTPRCRELGESGQPFPGVEMSRASLMSAWVTLSFRAVCASMCSTGSNDGSGSGASVAETPFSTLSVPHTATGSPSPNATAGGHASLRSTRRRLCRARSRAARERAAAQRRSPSRSATARGATATAVPHPGAGTPEAAAGRERSTPFRRIPIGDRIPRRLPGALSPRRSGVAPNGGPKTPSGRRTRQVPETT